MTPIPADAGAPPPAPGAPAPAPGAPAPAPGEPPGAPGAPPGAPDAAAPEVKQTKEELLFYAPEYTCLTVVALILFPPLGIPALVFSGKVGLRNPNLKLPFLQTKEANKKSQWEEAYINSGRTGWLDVFAILIGLGIIYFLVLFV
ncbi:hypothetical protein FD754_012692 [Muntiacus muntjak]|uniref:PMIS2 transmembrane protein n=1 Tax=Muntiacus muntjak TaxID=9888 RepID=A0A5N3VHH2_MUNMU|nr:hypothetical protein FD754_012692 [Muntiacus muntjak]